uniref:J domain-containing protein n=1 Tax=Leersia perrieri TaxID=77586 RepID=A0A0D9VUT6_9ORYZ
MDFSGGGGGAAASGRVQAERWLEIAGKLLAARDLVGCKRFAERAVEADPLLPGADELLAVADVLLASQSPLPSGHPDPLAVLQLPPGTNPADHAAVSRAFRRLALLLKQGSNPHPGADVALSLVHDAYAILSDPSRRPPPSSAGALAPGGQPAESPEFWTVCPFCCHAHQYLRELVGRALKCPNESCRKGFVAVEISPGPTIVPGTEMYHCAWGFFPLGYPTSADLAGNWKPFYKVFPWNNTPAGGGSGSRNYGGRGGGSAGRQPQNGSARGGSSSRGRVKKTTARKKVGAGLKRRTLGGGVESGIDPMDGQDGWAEGEEGGGEVRGININEEAQSTDGNTRGNVNARGNVGGGVEDMGTFHLDVDPSEDILGNLHNLPFLRVDNLGRML